MNANKWMTGLTACVTGVAAALLTASTARCADGDWQERMIAPVANPIYFEDPRIYSEARPIFMEHYLPKSFHFDGGQVDLGGEVRVYALQLRLKLTDRLALIATKDGYIEFLPDHTLSHEHGFADLAAGLKYAVIDDPEKQLIVTPGLTVTVPTGCDEVMQGHGSGEENLFVSAAKGWDDFHLMGNLGFRVPNDFDKQTAQFHYSLQLDYYVCQYFIPFFVMNGYTIVSEGKNVSSQALPVVPLNAEGYDLINFGATWHFRIIYSPDSGRKVSFSLHR